MLGGLRQLNTENLKELSRIFGITIDYFLDNNNELPLLVMKKKLDKENYKNKISSYEEVLKEYYPDPWKIYILTREKKMSKLEWHLVAEVKGTAPRSGQPGPRGNLSAMAFAVSLSGSSTR